MEKCTCMLLPLFFTCIAVLFPSYTASLQPISIKRFLKKKCSWCRDGSMNALAHNKVHKQEVPCTRWYWNALHTMATLFSNHPYISCSKLILVSTGVPLLFTYVGMITWPWYQSHCVYGTSVLCQPLIEPFLHQMDMETCFCCFLIDIVVQINKFCYACCPHTHS